MRTTDVTAPLRQAPDEYSAGWNWAEAAIAAWLAAAEHAGLDVTIRSTDHDSHHGRAALTLTGGFDLR